MSIRLDQFVGLVFFARMDVTRQIVDVARSGRITSASPSGPVHPRCFSCARKSASSQTEDDKKKGGSAWYPIELRHSGSFDTSSSMKANALTYCRACLHYKPECFSSIILYVLWDMSQDSWALATPCRSNNVRFILGIGSSAF